MITKSSCEKPSVSVPAQIKHTGGGGVKKEGATGAKSKQKQKTGPRGNLLHQNIHILNTSRAESPDPDPREQSDNAELRASSGNDDVDTWSKMQRLLDLALKTLVDKLDLIRV